MTRRLRTWGPVAAGLMAAWGCGSNNVCKGTACPDIAGTYTVTFNSNPLQAVGCAAGDAVASGPLTLTQSYAAIQGSFAGVPLTGTLQADLQLELRTGTGAATRTSYTFSGRVVVPQADAGGQRLYTGTLSATFADATDGGSTPCTVAAPFRATDG